MSSRKLGGSVARTGADEEFLWDKFARGHDAGTVFHSLAWKTVLEETFPHIRGRFLTVREPDGGIAAGIPAYCVSSRFLGTRLVSAPFASVCDPLAGNAGQWDDLLRAVEGWRARTNASFIEIRCLREIEHAEMPASVFYRQHILSLQPPVNDLYVRLSRTALRRPISKARSSGMKIRAIRNDDDLASFHALFALSRRRLGLPVMPLVFFRNLWRELHGSLCGWIAYKDSQSLAAVLGLSTNRTCFLEYSGESPDARGSGASQMLYWESVIQARANGDLRFHFGRTSTRNEGLLRYKRHWGAEESPILVYHFPKSDSPHPENSKSYKLVRTLLARCPGVFYPQLSRSIYRHLG